MLTLLRQTRRQRKRETAPRSRRLGCIEYLRRRGLEGRVELKLICDSFLRLQDGPFRALLADRDDLAAHHRAAGRRSARPLVRRERPHAHCHDHVAPPAHLGRTQAVSAHNPCGAESKRSKRS
eukprot:scaffold1610_cov257-Pinguiococcus_pyrenoidosus.AAC.6